MTECKRNVQVGRQLEKSAFISALIRAPFGCPIGHNAEPDMLDDNAMRLTFFFGGRADKLRTRIHEASWHAWLVVQIIEHFGS